MTEQGRPNGPDRTPRPAGYRGALAERDDRLAKPWVITVIAVFVLIVILSLAGVPSRFTEEPVPTFAPSGSPAGSVVPSAS